MLAHSPLQLEIVVLWGMDALKRNEHIARDLSSDVNGQEVIKLYREQGLAEAK